MGWLSLTSLTAKISALYRTETTRKSLKSFALVPLNQVILSTILAKFWPSTMASSTTPSGSAVALGLVVWRTRFMW